MKSQTQTNIQGRQIEKKPINVFETIRAVLCEDRELLLNDFKSGTFLLKVIQQVGMKIFTPKQILQKLPIALAQVKGYNRSEHFKNIIRQVMHSLYRAKENAKRVYHNIKNSIEIQYKIVTIFMNSKTVKLTIRNRT